MERGKVPNVLQRFVRTVGSVGCFLLQYHSWLRNDQKDISERRIQAHDSLVNHRKLLATCEHAETRDEPNGSYQTPFYGLCLRLETN